MKRMKRMKIIKNSLGLLLVVLAFISCSADNDSSQQGDQQRLDELLAEIHQMAENTSCTDDSNWAFTAYGSKACGGPIGYIIYSTLINTDSFLEKVAFHVSSQNEFNIKYGIVSDCSVPTMPTGVSCENGQPTLTY